MQSKAGSRYIMFGMALSAFALALLAVPACRKQVDRSDIRNLRVEPLSGGSAAEAPVTEQGQSPEAGRPVDASSDETSQTSSDTQPIDEYAQRRDSQTPPYLTVGVQDKPGEIIFGVGMPLNVYWEILPGQAESSWVALVPATVTSRLVKDNLAAALERQSTDSAKTLGRLVFTLQTEGEFILRLFASEDPSAQATGESQVFTVQAPQK